jgi:hypothetical protein
VVRHDDEGIEADAVKERRKPSPDASHDQAILAKIHLASNDFVNTQAARCAHIVTKYAPGWL